jgi:nucleotide-binding universal stress UspA family protein
MATWARPLGYIVCADGSKLSRDACELLRRLSHVPGDTMTVVHVEPRELPEDTPFDKRASSISDFWATHAQPQYGKYYLFKNVIKAENESSKTAVMSAAHAIAPPQLSDIIVVGYVGRKGPKEDPTVLGSVSDLTLRETGGVSSLIVKRVPPSAECTTFCVGVDGSGTAHSAVLLSMRLARPSDRVVIVHITGDGEATSAAEEDEGLKDGPFTTDAIAKVYTALAGGHPNTTFVLVPRRVGVEAPGTVSSRFLAVAEDEGADIVVIGVDGLSAKAAGMVAHVGSNTDAIARKAHCSVLTCHVRA